MERKMFTKALLFMMLCICSMMIIDVSVVSAASENVDDAKAEIVSEMKNFTEEIDLSSYSIDTTSLTSMMSSIFNEYPELFYVKDVYNYYYGTDNRVVSVKVQYTATKSDVAYEKEKFDSAVGKVLAETNSGMTDLQKVLVVHDYLALNTEYDYENFQNGDIPYNSYTAYGALVSKKAVCLGYAKAFMCIMQRLGIDCHIVASSEMNHAWNVVKIDGSYYNVDVTKDDAVYDTLGLVSHERFLVSDSKLRDKSYAIENVSYNADSTKYDNYFWNSVNSAILYSDGKWFYTENGMIYTYNFSTEEKSLFVDIDSEPWHVADSGSCYANSYSKIAVAGNKILYNTPSAIYVAYKDDGEAKAIKVYEVDTSKGTSIYGLAFVEENLYCQLKSIASEEGSKINTNLTKSELANKEVASEKKNEEVSKDVKTEEKTTEEKDGRDSSTTDTTTTTNKKENAGKEKEKPVITKRKSVMTIKDIIDYMNNSNKSPSVNKIKEKLAKNNVKILPIVEKVEAKNDIATNDSVQDFALNTEKLSIKTGDMAQLFVGKMFVTDAEGDINVSWSSSDESVVKIDKYGRIQAVSEGKATIRCTINSVTKECEIDVHETEVCEIKKRYTIDCDNYWRKTSFYIRKIPKKMAKESGFIKKAMNTRKGYKAERISKRALKPFLYEKC